MISSIKEIEELKKANSWLIPFGLSDQEFYDVDICGSRVRAGSDDLVDLIPNLKDKIIGRTSEIINQIALAIAINKLWPMHRYINGNVAEFIKSLGGVPPKPKKKKIRKKKSPSEKEPTDYLIKTETSNTPNGSTAMTFSTMDEEEVKKIEVPQPEGYVVDYDVLADDIISEFRYNENDEILHKRLSNIIISRFRDVRDELESVDALTKSRKIGGMEFTQDQAKELLKLIKKKQESFREHHISTEQGVQRIEFASKKPEYVRPETRIKTLEEKRAEDMKKGGIERAGQSAVSQEVVQDNSTSTVKADEKSTPAPVMDEEDGLPVLRMPEDLMVKPEVIEINHSSVLHEEPKKLEPEIVSVSPIAKEIDSKPKDENLNSFVKEKTIPVNFAQPISPKGESAPLPRPAPYVVSKDIPQRVIESQNTRRPIVDGIKLTKKLTGPIEELGDMTLIDFRRLASDPVSAANEIKEKVKLLEEESYVRRMEGVDAWLGNEVNRFYRLLGQSSMAEGKSIEDVIKERLVAGKPTLSMEEFDAVMQLNSELRY